MSLFTRELLESFEASTRPLAEACTLPPLVYTDPEFFAFEKEAVFAHEWLCLGRTSQVPNPGDFTSTRPSSLPSLKISRPARSSRAIVVSRSACSLAPSWTPAVQR